MKIIALPGFLNKFIATSLLTKKVRATFYKWFQLKLVTLYVG